MIQRDSEEFFRWAARIANAEDGEVASLLLAAEAEQPGMSQWLEDLIATGEEAPVTLLDAGSDGDLTSNPIGQAYQQAIAARRHQQAGTDQRFSAYEILDTKPAGVGGMGQVYKVRHKDGRFEGPLALKVLHRTGPSFRSRFEHEKNVLLSLKHPNIAHVLDHGTSLEGFPFFVMQYIEGEPIDEYCHSKSLRERVRLIVELCQAVSACHARAVIHRDIKPSNVLVAPSGRPVLLDFGIAKSLEDDSLTHTGERMMSGGYGSPEQLLGEPTSTQSDVHGLGCLLFRVLNGGLPYPHQHFGEWSEAVRHQQPAALTQGLESQPALRRQLSGELESIVGKALRKRPERRYATVEALARDLRAYLDGRPVEAAPEARLYLLRKAVVRHKVLVASVGVIMLILTWALSLSYLQRNRALEATRQAQVAESTTRQVAETYQQVLLLADGGDVPATDFIHHGAQLAGEMKRQPAVQAQVFMTLGVIERNLGHFDEAQNFLTQASHNLEGSQQLRALIELGAVHHRSGKYQEATSVLGRAVARCAGEAALCAAARNELGMTQFALGNLREAETTLNEALAEAESVGSIEELAEIRTNLSQVLSQQGRDEESLYLAYAALEARKEALGERHLLTAEAQHNLGLALGQKGDLEKAELLVRAGYATRRTRLGPEHRWTLQSLKALGQVLRYQGNLVEAELVAKETLTGYESSYGSTHPWTLGAKQNLGWILLELGRTNEANTLFQQVLSHRRKEASPADLGKTLIAAGDAALRANKAHDAEAYLEEASTLLAASLGKRSRHYWRARALWGLSLYAQEGQNTEACAGYRGLEETSDIGHSVVLSFGARLRSLSVSC